MENARVIYVMRGVILMETAMDLRRAWFVVDGARQQVNVAHLIRLFSRNISQFSFFVCTMREFLDNNFSSFCYAVNWILFFIKRFNETNFIQRKICFNSRKKLLSIQLDVDYPIKLRDLWTRQSTQPPTIELNKTSLNLMHFSMSLSARATQFR